MKQTDISEWVPLTIEHETGYPEDVAYGPERMMNRLKVWLTKYFEMIQSNEEVKAAFSKVRAKGCSDPNVCSYHAQCMGGCCQPLKDMNTAITLRSLGARVQASQHQVTVPIDVLKAAINPEAGHVIYAHNGPRGSESTDCTGCGRRNGDGWGEPIEHKDDCSYVAKQNALGILCQIVADAEQ